MNEKIEKEEKTSSEIIKQINDILEQLDIKNIEITRPILNKLDEIFKSSNKFINKFKVSNIIELIKNKDYINFYYFLFAYILKHPYYIYQFEFLKQKSVPK